MRFHLPGMWSTGPEHFTDIRWLFVWGNIHRVGGTEARMITVAREMKRRGFAVQFIMRSTDPDSAFIESVRASGVELEVARSWLSFIRILARRKPSVIWAFGLKQSLAIRVLSFLKPISVVTIMARNGLDYGWARWMFLLDRWTQKKVDAYVTNSNSVLDHLISHGIDSTRVRCVTSGISGEWLQNRVESVNTDLIMVGNSRPEKNHETAVRAFLGSPAEGTLTVLTDDGASLRHVLKEYSPADRDRVVILEGVRATASHYDSVGIFLHPSLSESLPLAALEATARGCYVVAGDTGDIRNLLREGSGVLVDIGTPASIAEGLRRARRTVGASGYTRCFVDHKTAETYTEELVQLVRELAHERAPGGKT